MNTESNESIQELLQILATAKEDVKDNRIAPVQETFDSIREALKKNNPKKINISVDVRFNVHYNILIRRDEYDRYKRNNSTEELISIDC